MPRHAPALYPSWDPAITVGPSGTVYVAFMIADPNTNTFFSIVDTSTDHGRSFTVNALPAPADDFGGRDFIAIVGLASMWAGDTIGLAWNSATILAFCYA